MINPQLVAVLPKTESLDMPAEGVSTGLGDELQLIDNNSFNFDETLLTEIRSVSDGLEMETAAEESLLSLELPGGKELPLLPQAEELAETESVVLAGTMANITEQPDTENLSVATVLLAGGRNADNSLVMSEGDIDKIVEYVYTL